MFYILCAMGISLGINKMDSVYIMDFTPVYFIREVAHYVLLSRNVNTQRIRLAFTLREIFHIAHYDSI